MKKIETFYLNKMIDELMEFVIGKQLDDENFMEGYLYNNGNKKLELFENNKRTILTYNIYDIKDDSFVPIKMEFSFEDDKLVIYNNFDADFYNGDAYIISIDLFCAELEKNYEEHPYLKEFVNILKYWNVKNNGGLEPSDDWYRLDCLMSGQGKIYMLSKDKNKYRLLSDFVYKDN